MLVTYHIEVLDRGGNARVIRTPPEGRLKKSRGDTVKFTSNDPRTVIQYEISSPFVEVHFGDILDIGDGDGPAPLTATIVGDPHHFKCGFRNKEDNGKFAPWGDTPGGDTPVDP